MYTCDNSTCCILGWLLTSPDKSVLQTKPNINYIYEALRSIAPVGYLCFMEELCMRILLVEPESAESHKDYPRTKIERPQRARNGAPW